MPVDPGDAMRAVQQQGGIIITSTSGSCRIP